MDDYYDLSVDDWKWYTKFILNLGDDGRFIIGGLCDGDEYMLDFLWYYLQEIEI